jgi:hypothetical protein
MAEKIKGTEKTKRKISNFFDLIQKKIRKRDKIKISVQAELRWLHTFWTLWVVALVVTIIISPHMLVTWLYQFPASGLLILVFLIAFAIMGFFVGGWVINRYVKEKFIEKIGKSEPSEIRSVWPRIGVFFLVPAIVTMDLLSVVAESYYYNSVVVTQSTIYVVSFILLVFTTILLASSLIKNFSFKLQKWE